MIGENGKEAIVPLENNTEWIDKLVNKLSQVQSNQNIEVVVKIGDEQLTSKIIKNINRQSRISGKSVIAF
jgi:hypothetical protein